jgi:predicted DNA-binding protein with PD1-like motif
MQYFKIKDGYVLRLQTGEEIITILKDFIIDKKINSGFVNGIGAGKEITLGYFDYPKKSYHKRFFADEVEFTSIMGNIVWLECEPNSSQINKTNSSKSIKYEKQGEPIIHLHAVISPENFISYSGHLFSGIVTATCEIIIWTIEKKLKRALDKNSGLNLLDLNHR